MNAAPRCGHAKFLVLQNGSRGAATQECSFWDGKIEGFRFASNKFDGAMKPGRL